MHEGGSLGASLFVYAQERGAPRRRNKGRRVFVHQALAVRCRKSRRDLVQRERRYKGRRVFVHQALAVRGRKSRWDLVQRERRNKGRQVFMHQFCAVRGRKSRRNLVQRERRNKGWRVFVHQVRTGRKRKVGAGCGRKSPRRPPKAYCRPLLRKFINFRMIIKVY